VCRVLSGYEAINNEAASAGRRPQVCLELDDATLGGLAMGVGMTTASHIFGLYQETIVSMSVVSAGSAVAVSHPAPKSRCSRFSSSAQQAVGRGGAR
jgi:FAD/FMN-containing dehydrogenase